MYPHDLEFHGYVVSIWNAVFVAAIVAAFVVFLRSARREAGLTLPLVRYLVVVYLSALAAQLFSYAFDATTSLTPPAGISFASWYLNPLASPKTLYGVIVLMPVSVWIAIRGTGLALARALDLWTPAMLWLLAAVRVGCLLQGCCYGARSALFGVRFPKDSLVFWHQIHEGVIASDATAALPVVPTQGIEAAVLASLGLWSTRREQAGEGDLFLRSILAYSIFRFAIEFVRADAVRGTYGPLTTSQWIAFAVVAAAAGQAWRRAGEGRTADAIGFPGGGGGPMS